MPINLLKFFEFEVISQWSNRSVSRSIIVRSNWDPGMDNDDAIFHRTSVYLYHFLSWHKKWQKSQDDFDAEQFLKSNCHYAKIVVRTVCIPYGLRSNTWQDDEKTFCWTPDAGWVCSYRIVSDFRREITLTRIQYSALFFANKKFLQF